MIHLIYKDDFFVTDGLQKAFEAADEVYLEIAPNKPDLDDKSEELQKLPLDKELKDFVKAADYEIIRIFKR